MRKIFLCFIVFLVACLVVYGGNEKGKSKRMHQPVYCTWTMQFGDTPVVRQFFTYDRKGRLTSDSFAVLSGRWLLYDTAFRYEYNFDSVSYIQSGKRELLVVTAKKLPLLFLNGFGLVQNVYYDARGTLTHLTSTWLNEDLPDSLRTTVYDSIAYQSGNIVSCIVKSGRGTYTQKFTYYDSLVYKPKFNSHTLHKPLADDALEAQLFSKNLIKSVTVPKSKYENYMHHYRYWFDKRGRIIKVERQTAFDGIVTSTTIGEYVYRKD